MLKSKFAAFAAVILAAAASSVAAQQATQAGVGGAIPDGKIAVINTQVFPSTISELKVKYEQVNNQFKARLQGLQNLSEQMKTMENDLRTKQNVLAADKYQELQASYEDAKRRGTREQEDLNNDVDRALDAATKPIRDKLYQFLQTYSAQRGVVLVINLAGAAQSGTLAFWNPGVDITEDFINEYNKANPVAGAPPSAPATTQPKPQPVKPAGKP
ncbi:MAG TPA: OmpH family outer membrane protein [Blastocatellia bacterium]|nr:OmpH family outer membrane protein [Blastocatellia bacterium]